MVYICSVALTPLKTAKGHRQHSTCNNTVTYQVSSLPIQQFRRYQVHKYRIKTSVTTFMPRQNDDADGAYKNWLSTWPSNSKWVSNWILISCHSHRVTSRQFKQQPKHWKWYWWPLTSTPHLVVKGTAVWNICDNQVSESWTSTQLC